jgi:predicted RNase H-like nuclease (RuvC/YqgF family)
MSNDKYVKHYVEILTDTMSDAVIRNISMQANAKISDEVIGELTEKIKFLEQQNGELQTSAEETNKQRSSTENNTIHTLENKVTEQRNIISDLQNQIRSLEGVKSQVSHLEGFRNELIKAREENAALQAKYDNDVEELNNKIESLQLTPTPSKKKVEKPKKNIEVVSSLPTAPVTLPIRDGGSF